VGEISSLQFVLLIHFTDTGEHM